MRNIALLTVLFLTANFAYAQDTPEKIIDSFFASVSKGKITDAIKNMPTSEKFESDTSFTTRLDARLKELTKNSGEYCGYELISVEEVSPSYVIYSYFIKYMNAPQQIQFIFYKPKDSWQVNNVSFSGQSMRPSNVRPGTMRPGARM